MSGESSKSVLPRRVMLSGYDTEEEKKAAVNIIERLQGVHLTNLGNPQEFMPSCTHVICTQPSRSEKYLAACASGKWVLTPQYLTDSGEAGMWLSEGAYQWADAVTTCSVYAKNLQEAPKRWRESIVTKGCKLPFTGWNVGLVMNSTFGQAFTRIVRAGGGNAVDVTSSYIEGRYSGERIKEDEFLTHVLVTPDFKEKIIRRPEADDIPHLRAGYLSCYLLNETPPSIEKYYIFEKFRSTHQSLHKSRLELSASQVGATKDPSMRKDATTSPSTKIAYGTRESSKSGSDRPVSPVLTSRRSTALSQTSTGSPAGIDHYKTKAAKPLPASLIARSSLLTVSTSVPQSPVSKTSSPSSSKKSSVTRDNVPTAQKSVLHLFESARPVLRVNVAKLDSDIATQRLKKSNNPSSTPTISLGCNRKNPAATTPKPSSSSESGSKSQKRLFSDDFVERNKGLLEEFIMKRQQRMSYKGILDEITKPYSFLPDNNYVANAKPFCREVMADLEATLEVNCSYSYFLKLVTSQLSRESYPPPDVLYVIMKVILLDCDDSALSMSAYNALSQVLETHPPQAKHIKTEKLYHKSFTAMTMPDMNETPSLVITVGEILSRTHDKDWREWGTRDQTLGVHWSFYSRVLNIATQLTKNVLRTNGGSSTASDKRIRNAALLTQYLTNLVVKDYKDVITRGDYPSHSPMIKCLIAELLWPTMTGLEPWFRRPSTNLADLASLYVKAVEAHLCQLRAFESNDENPAAADSADDDEFDFLEISRSVLVHISRIVAITASWCVFCDLRDKQRGKRTSTRTLENELVSVIRAELDDKKMDVIKPALSHLPLRLRLKVNVALVQHNCSDVLVRDDYNKKDDEKLSLEIITSRFMQTFPSLQQGEERDFSIEHSGSGWLSSKSDSSGSRIEKAPEPGLSSKVMKRNHKGETPLHIACMKNRPENVRYLLNRPGVQPNATDYAGWTPLGEACNHGHVECVRALLSLPLKKFSVNSVTEPLDDDDRSPNAWEIDLVKCPPLGRTPLHDALGSDHIKIACMLLRKGGVKLLDIMDSQGRSPLEYCKTEVAQSTILEYACKLAAKTDSVRSGSSGDDQEDELMELTSAEDYEKILPRKSVLTSPNWRERVIWWSEAISLLISNYVRSGGLIYACETINISKHRAPSLSSKNLPEPGEIEQYANDLMYCYRWKECWYTYTNHLCRLLGSDEESIGDVLARALTPIPLDLSLEASVMD